MTNRVFAKIEDAPTPSKDGEKIYIEVSYFELTEYVAVDGKWVCNGPIYPATMD